MDESAFQLRECECDKGWKNQKICGRSIRMALWLSEYLHVRYSCAVFIVHPALRVESTSGSSKVIGGLRVDHRQRRHGQ